jgi:lysophospholipase L1-like esterase
MVALFVLVSVTAVVSLVVAFSGPPGVAAEGAASPVVTSGSLPAAHKITAIIVGDSYAEGAGGIPLQSTFPVLACNQLGWVCNIDAQGGTGYASDGEDAALSNERYVGRLDHLASSYTADYFIVTGGRNDANKSGAQASIKDYLTRIRRAFPSAKIVIISPFWGNQQPPQEMVQLRQIVKSESLAVGAIWVDSSNWLNSGLVGLDGVHPNLAGQRALADRLVQALRANGAPSGRR